MARFWPPTRAFQAFFWENGLFAGGIRALAGDLYPFTRNLRSSGGGLSPGTGGVGLSARNRRMVLVLIGHLTGKVRPSARNSRASTVNSRLGTRNLLSETGRRKAVASIFPRWTRTPKKLRTAQPAVGWKLDARIPGGSDMLASCDCWPFQIPKCESSPTRRP